MKAHCTVFFLLDFSENQDAFKEDCLFWLPAISLITRTAKRPLPSPSFLAWVHAIHMALSRSTQYSNITLHSHKLCASYGSHKLHKTPYPCSCDSRLILKNCAGQIDPLCFPSVVISYIQLSWEPQRVIKAAMSCINHAIADPGQAGSVALPHSV